MLLTFRDVASTGVAQVTWQKLTKNNAVQNLATYSKRFGEQVNGPFQGKISFRKATLSLSSITLKNVTWEDDSCYICSFNVFPDGSKRKQVCLEVQGKCSEFYSKEPAALRAAAALRMFFYYPLMKEYLRWKQLTELPARNMGAWKRSCSAAPQPVDRLQPSSGPSQTATLLSANPKLLQWRTGTTHSQAAATSLFEYRQGGVDMWTVCSTEGWWEKGRSKSLLLFSGRKTTPSQQRRVCKWIILQADFHTRVLKYIISFSRVLYRIVYHTALYCAVVSLIVLFWDILSHIISSIIISHCIVIQWDIITIPGIWLPNKLIFNFNVHHVTVCAFAVGCIQYLLFPTREDLDGTSLWGALSNQISQRLVCSW